MNVWMSLVGYSSLFIQTPLTPYEFADLNNTRYAFYAGIILGSLSFALLGNRLDSLFRESDPILPVFTGLVMSLSTVVFAFAYAQNVVDSLSVALCTCFISGFCYNLFVFILYVRLAKHTPLSVAIAAVAASLIIDVMFEGVFDVVSQPLVHLIVGTVMPLSVVLLLILVVPRIATNDYRDIRVTGKERIYHVALIFVASFGSIAVMAAANVGSVTGLWGTRVEVPVSSLPPLFDALMVVIALAIFCVLAYFILAKRSHDRVSVRYQIPFLIIIAGCILMILNEFTLPSGVFSFEAILIRALDLFARLFSWTLTMSVIQTVDISHYRILGFRGLFFNSLAIVWLTVLEGNGQLISTVVLLIIFILVTCITIFPLGLTRQVAVGDNTKAICDMLSKRYGLSNREKEILVLLAQGRSRPYIQQELHLADGTVKTHTTHIYAKMQVHSRQELLDLVLEARGGNG
jgi:DNA-binding CsgD family transcriptional regulator